MNKPAQKRWAGAHWQGGKRGSSTTNEWIVRESRAKGTQELTARRKRRRDWRLRPEASTTTPGIGGYFGLHGGLVLHLMGGGC
jgi:hypothetical protein